MDFIVRLRMSNWIIFYITFLNWEFLLKSTISFETFVESGISYSAPRSPLILTVKFHSLYVKELEILERLESDILPPTLQPCLRPPT